MPRLLREQSPRLRRTIGAVFLVFVWALFGVRIIWGIGPMHDYEHKQAPATHYLGLALIITAVVVVWLIVRERMERSNRQE